MSYIVYIATSPSGKKYVGKCSTHKKGFIQRKNKHYRGADKGLQIPFARAIRKYGRSCIVWEVVARFDDEEHAFRKEQETIAKLQTTDPKIGYNCTNGGRGRPGLVHREDSKLKMSLKNKLTKAVISSDGKIFHSLTAAGRAAGVSYTAVRQALDKNRTCSGLMWKTYVGDRTEGYFEKIVMPYSSISRGVIRSDGKVYDCMSVAAREIGVNTNCISQAIAKGFNSGGFKWKYYQ